jgi:hypothetical protein
MIPLVTLAVYLLMRFLPFVDPLRANYRLFGDAYAIIRLWCGGRIPTDR